MATQRFASRGLFLLAVELQVLQDRLDLHAGPVHLAAELRLTVSTIGQVLRHWAVPRLADLHGITGELRRHRVTGERNDHDGPGGLLQIDVKKLGRIPPGAGLRLREAAGGWSPRRP